MNKLLLCFMLVAQMTLAQKSETKEVEGAFLSYKKEILAANGTEAVRYLDKNTIDYYEKILDWTRNAKSAQLDKQTIIDKMNVYTARHRVPAEQLRKMSGKEFLAYAINNGMIGKNSVAALEMGEITVNGTSAKGRAVANGTKTPLFFSFNKEEGQWRVDLTSIFPATNDALKKVVESTGMTDDEFIFKALESVSGKPVSASIRQPLN